MLTELRVELDHLYCSHGRPQLPLGIELLQALQCVLAVDHGGLPLSVLYPAVGSGSLCRDTSILVHCHQALDQVLWPRAKMATGGMNHITNSHTIIPLTLAVFVTVSHSGDGNWKQEWEQDSESHHPCGEGARVLVIQRELTYLILARLDELKQPALVVIPEGRVAHQ